MPKPQNPADLLPLTAPVFHILVALAEEERHGYGIMQDVAEQTAGGLQLGPGTLYGCLKRMLAAGLVAESDERPDPALDDERRRYYRMTDLGRRVERNAQSALHRTCPRVQQPREQRSDRHRAVQDDEHDQHHPRPDFSHSAGVMHNNPP